MSGWNSLVGEPYPVVDDPSGMLDLVQDETGSYGMNAYPAGDGTHISVAAIVVVAAVVIVLLRMGGFQGTIAVSRA